VSEKKKVLIIDDDVDFSESIATFLDLSGYQALQAFDADEGVKLATAEKPDVILCDVIMRERTAGFFAVQRLRRTPGLEQIPILMVSSVYAHEPTFRIEPDKSWLPHDGFMKKPIDPRELLEKIEQVV
jgi:CheY-like chemotaxis protein